MSQDIQLPENFTPTHQTAGLPGFPAIDVFAPARSFVLAPEAGKLIYPHKITWDQRQRVGGWTCYFQGESGNTYFLTHFGNIRQRGHYNKHEVIGTVGQVPHSWWHSHIHEGKHKGIFNPEHS